MLGRFLSENEKALFKLRELYESMGYEKYKMSKFEEYDLYAENKSFLKSENVIAFTDLSGKLMALKPDVTLSIAKNSLWSREKFHKVYYTENVYRSDLGAAQFKEIMQVGLEYIGEIDSYVMLEVLSLAAKSLETISPDYIMDISHMGFIEGLFEAAGIRESKYVEFADVISKKDYAGVLSLCEKEEVGEVFRKKIAALTRIYGSFIECAEKIESLILNEKMEKAFKEISSIFSILKNNNIKIDLSLISDMNYYNGITFRGFVKDIPSSILSGGRYDNLIAKLGKKNSAIGFAVYMDLLDIYRKENQSYDVDCILVYNENDDISKVFSEAESLRKKGYTVSVLKERTGVKCEFELEFSEGVSESLERRDTND